MDIPFLSVVKKARHAVDIRVDLLPVPVLLAALQI